MSWKVYNDLAWTEHILAAPETYKDEAMIYVKSLEGRVSGKNPTMLHLGCGAGGHDFHFKEYFTVTGVDLSDGMLSIASTTNSEIVYIKGDMRNVELGKKFDVVAIPDSIAYMRSFEDLTATLKTAKKHLQPDGVLLVVAHIKEEFKNNNFAYTGEKDDIHITVFENNFILSDGTYEATMIYLIRRNGELNIHHETHTLGLFTYAEWVKVFSECQLKMDVMNLDHLYDPCLLEDGEYKLKMFLGTSTV